MSTNITHNWPEREKRKALRIIRFYEGHQSLRDTYGGKYAGIVPDLIPIHTRTRTRFERPAVENYVAEKIAVEIINYFDKSKPLN